MGETKRKLYRPRTLACPHCQSRDKFVVVVLPDAASHHVMCDCGYTGPRADGVHAAITAHNRSAP